MSDALETQTGAVGRSLDVLVLGGTSWLGGEVTRQGLARGHRVTCLARGESGVPPDGAQLVVADRSLESAYDAVQDHDWDFVVDVARQPLHVRTAVHALRHRARHWVFVSTMSVYADDQTAEAGEDAVLHEPWSGQGLAGIEDYGPAKVACEDAVRAVYPDALLARAGLIVGYGDRSDRFGYWPARLARVRDGEPVLTPPLGDPCQVIDVEDLARWLVHCGEGGIGGAVNAIGPTMSLGETLEACAEAAGARPSWVVADHAWLTAQGVEPWMGPRSLPLWLPQPGYAGFMTRRRQAAVGRGLTTRPVVDSARAALRWEREQGLDRPRHAGLQAHEEAELLALLT